MEITQKLYTIQKQLHQILELKKKPIFQNKYNANVVYEWNIDGISEYNILNTLYQMKMVLNVHKTQKLQIMQ